MIFDNKSWLNKLLMKYFNRKFIYQKGVCYSYHAKINYTCDLCKESLYKLPNIGTKKFVYKLIDEQKVEVAEEYNDECVKVYGWVIEVRYQYSNNVDKWYNYANHKVYSTKQTALDAAIQARVPNGKVYNDKFEWRVAPVYRIEQNYYRTIAINQIIEEKKQ